MKKTEVLPRFTMPKMGKLTAVAVKLSEKPKTNCVSFMFLLFTGFLSHVAKTPHCILAPVCCFCT